MKPHEFKEWRKHQTLADPKLKFYYSSGVSLSATILFLFKNS